MANARRHGHVGVLINAVAMSEPSLWPEIMRRGLGPYREVGKSSSSSTVGRLLAEAGNTAGVRETAVGTHARKGRGQVLLL